jgi:glycosyltransferase involved in cell wall biosynthesis
MLEAVAGLIGRGVDVELVVPEPGDVGEQGRLLGARVWSVPTHIWTQPWRRPRALFGPARLARHAYASARLARLLTRIRPDVAITNTLTQPTGALAARALSIPHVWYVRELFGPEGASNITFDLGPRLTLSLIDRLSVRLITTSSAIERQLGLWIDAGKLRTLDSPVEVDGAAVPPPGLDSSRPLSLVQVGSKVPAKRQEDVIRATGELVRRGHDARLRLIGAEPTGYANTLRRLVRELGLDGRVELLPFTLNRFEHIRAADVVVMPAKGEAFGRVTVEAMKLGRTVVGARSGGTADLIADGTTGYLFEPMNVGDLADRLERLAVDRGLLVQTGDAAAAWSRARFRPEPYFEGLLGVLGQAIESRCPLP